MRLNLLVDSSFIFYKNVYTLANTKTLYGDLEKSLEISYNNYLNKYPFEKIYIVADSKYSWRKNIYPDYKGKRKENRDKQDIDWEFCFNTYNDFKETLKENNRIVFLEYDGVEADDIIAYIIKESNKKGISNLYVSSDGDLKQLLDYKINPRYINIQWRDEFKRPKLYLPEGYKLFFNDLRNDKGDIFSLNDNSDFLRMIETFMEKVDIEEVDIEQLLFVKFVHGDKGDNIESVLKVPAKSNPSRLMGIGEAGANKIYTNFKTNNPKDIDFSSNDWLDVAAGYIAENKKVDLIDHESEIIDNLKINRKLIHLELEHFPNSVMNHLKKIEI
jgi:5'-3' exonuclease